MSKFLYTLITDRKLYKQPLTFIAQSAEAAGVDYFHLREKDLTAAELLPLAQQVRSLLKRTKFIVNGQLDVAVGVGADGVHLQKGNLPVTVVRKKFPEILIGYSAHSGEEMLQAEYDGASYVFIGPVFTPRSKGTFLPGIGIDTAARWLKGVRIPVFALGGITAENIAVLPPAGFAGAAAISLFAEKGYFSSNGMVI